VSVASWRLSYATFISGDVIHFETAGPVILIFCLEVVPKAIPVLFGDPEFWHLLHISLYVVNALNSNERVLGTSKLLVDCGAALQDCAIGHKVVNCLSPQ
jgi:hypothetical protein